MDLMDMFNEVLASDRRLSQEVYEQNEEKFQDKTLDISRISYYVNPIYAQGQISKPYIVSSQYQSRKKNPPKKSGYLEELKHLLALAEIRYLENATKLQSAILNSKTLYHLRLINYLKRVYPGIQNMQKMLLKIYLYKWRSKHKDLSKSLFSFENRKKFEVFQKFKLRSLLLLLEKIKKLNTLKAFISFKERGIINEFCVQYYGIESLSKKKLNKFLPPHSKEESNKVKMKKLGLSDKSPSRPIARIKSYFN
jgi:hypothetical protein